MTPPEKLFLDNLKLIERVVAWACRTHYCRGEEAEDFAGQIKIKLVDNDYAVLRKYSGKSTLKTYLSAVVLNYFHDYRNHLWGKWRPSAEAVRLGEVAIKLEELVWRDSRTFDEACETLRINYKLDTPQAELDRIAARLPQKPPRRLVSEDELRERPTPSCARKRRSSSRSSSPPGVVSPPLSTRRSPRCPTRICWSSASASSGE